MAAGREKPTCWETVSERKAGVYVLSPTGKVAEFINIPHDVVTNCVFEGDDLQTLYITAGGRWWPIRTHTPGWVGWPPRRTGR
ncbi:MAG: hypothetical protein CMJ59_13965 [Planctomycetaceae bacterium]|nr:hypothetical protein [Planctomycetaceae bacterium]